MTHKNLGKILFKGIATIVFISLLAIISLSVLITYDIVNYNNPKVTNTIKGLVLSLPFMPKTGDYIMDSIEYSLRDKPLDITMIITTMSLKKEINLNFSVTGKLFLGKSNNDKTSANLYVYQKDNKIMHLIYLDNILYTNSIRYNWVIKQFLKEFLNLPVRLTSYKWSNNPYIIPYSKITKEIHNVALGSTYFNKDANTLRIRIDKKQLENITQDLKSVDYAQLTKNLDSATITIFLSEDNKNIRNIEVEATDKDEIEYLITIKIKESEPFTIKSPKLN